MVVHLAKSLDALPPTLEIPGIRVRNYGSATDVAAWLEIRNRAFAGQIAPGPGWGEEDFRREFLAKPWWREDWLWFAEAQQSASVENQAVGAVGLGVIQRNGEALAAVQWLAVLPAWRRRGVGAVLLARLEAAAWEAGFRQVFAETLEEWDAAVRFYQKVGYRKSGTQRKVRF